MSDDCFFADHSLSFNSPLRFQIKTIRVPHHTVTPASGCIQPRVKLHSLEPFPELLTAAWSPPQVLPNCFSVARIATALKPTLFSWVSGGLCLGGTDKGLEKRHTGTCFVQPILWLALELWAREVSACDEMSRGGRGAHHPHLFPGGLSFRLWSWRTVNSSVNSCSPVHRSPSVSPETSTPSVVWRLNRGDGRRDRTRGFSSCLCLSFACDLSLGLSIWTMGWDGIKESLPR